MATNVSSAGNSFTPNVYITKVIIQESGKPFTESQSGHGKSSVEPHINMSSHDADMVGLDSKYQKSVDGKNLKITLHLCIKETMPKGQSAASIFGKPKVLKKFNLCVVQNTSPTMASVLSSKKAFTENFPNLFDEYSIIDGMQVKYYNVKELMEYGKNNSNASSGKKQASPAKITYLGNKQVNEWHFKIENLPVIPGGKPKHLSYFVLPYLDTKTSASKYASDNLESGARSSPFAANNSMICGKGISEVVIDNYGTAESSFVFLDSNNSIYAGPIDKAGKGYQKGFVSPAAGGALNMPPPTDTTLSVAQMTNSKVQDFTIDKELAKKKFNFSILPNFLVKQAYNDQYAKQKTNKPAYFTDLSLSRDSQSNCRFFFGIDYRTVLKNESVFPNLYELPDTSMVTSFVDNSVIKKFRIVRRRVKENCALSGEGLTACAEHEEYESRPPDLIVETSEAESATNKNNSIGAVSDFVVNHGIGDGGKKIMGSVHEAPLTLPAAKNAQRFRHFSGIDKQIHGETNGTYQYGVELEIVDGTVKILNNVLKDSGTAIQNLKNYYYNVMSSPSYVDSKMDTFTDDFLKKSFKKYSNVCTEAFSSFLDLMTLLGFKTTSDLWKTVGLPFINMTTPDKATTESLLHIINVFESLHNRLLSQIGSLNTTKRFKAQANQGEGYKSPISSKSNSLKTFKIKHWFSDVFDASAIKGYGYEFLSRDKPFGVENRGNNNGMVILKGTDLVSRTSEEIQKLFTNEAASGQIPAPVDTKYTTSDNLNATRYAYLTPSYVHLPTLEKPFKQLDVSMNTLEKSKYAHLLTDILLISANGDFSRVDAGHTSVENESELMTAQNQALREKGLKVLSARGCIISSLAAEKQAISTDGVHSDGLGAIEIAGTLSTQPDGGQEGWDSVTNAPPGDSPRGIASLPSKDPIDLDIKSTVSADLGISIDPSSLILGVLNRKHLKISDKLNSLKAFDLDNNPNNLIDKWWTGKPNASGQGQTAKEMIIKKAPNHIKYLFAHGPAIPGASSNSLKHVWEKDVMKDPKWYPAIYMNFKNLVKLEVLIGYKSTTGQDNGSAKAPEWKELTQAYLQQPGTYLCRMKYYESDIFGIKHIEELKLPIYHETFLLQVAGGPPLTVTKGLQKAGFINKAKSLTSVNMSATTPYLQTNIVSEQGISGASSKYLTIKLGENALKKVANTKGLAGKPPTKKNFGIKGGGGI